MDWDDYSDVSEDEEEEEEEEEEEPFDPSAYTEVSVFDSVTRVSYLCNGMYTVSQSKCLRTI